MSRPILVPVHLVAKVLSAPVKVPNLNAAAGPDLTLAPGVHLHWALPSALTTARNIECQGRRHKILPAAPTHWLVTRTVPLRKPLADRTRREIRAWLVDSVNATTPVQLKSGQTLNIPGNKVEAGKVFTMFGLLPSAAALGYPGWGIWGEEGEGEPETSSESPNLAKVLHAAYYPGAINRFGMHDDLRDLAPLSTTDPLSYTVVGWYADGDPLALSANRANQLTQWHWSWRHIEVMGNARPPAIGRQSSTTTIRSTQVRIETSSAAQQAHLQRLAMGLNLSPVDNPLIPPDHIVCHGNLYNVSLKVLPADYTSKPAPDKVSPLLTTSIHRAMAGALGTQAETPSDSTLTDLVELGISGDFEALSTLNGLSDAQNRAHERTFRSVMGRGQRYAVLSLPNTIPIRIPENQFLEFSSQLERRQFDQTVALFKHRLASLAGASAGVHPTRFMVRRESRTVGQNSGLRLFDVDITSPEDPLSMLRLRALADMSLWLGLLADAKIHEEPGQRWYASWAPHLLLQNIGSSGFGHNGGDRRFSESGVLECRDRMQVLNGLNLQSLVGRKMVQSTISAVDFLSGLDLVQNPLLPSTAAGLLAEAVMLDPNNAPLMAAVWRIKAKAATGTPPSETEVSCLANVVRNALQGLLAVRALHSQPDAASLEPEQEVLESVLNPNAGSTWPSPVCQGLWEQPWIPLMADVKLTYLHLPVATFWKLDGVPLGGDSNSRQRGAEMGLNPQLETALCSPTQPPVCKAQVPAEFAAQSKDVEYSERVLLTGAVRRTLLRQLKTAQSAGYYGQLQPVHLSVLADPKNTEISTRASTNTDESVDLAQANVLSGSFTGFDGFVREECGMERCGSLRLKQITVIDAFGERLIPSSITQPASTGKPKPGNCWTPLPPRIPAWARLQFRLSSATAKVDDVDPDMGDTAVCGFLIPDLIEHALEVYDHRGNGIGQITNETASESALPRPVFRLHPWMVESGAQVSSPSDSRQISNRHLRELVQGIEAQPLEAPEYQSDPPPVKETGLTALMRVIETMRTTVGHADRLKEWKLQLMGRPIAVVRARMWYEVNDSALPVLREAVGSIWDHSKRVLPLSVKVGDENRPNDGVLGMFISGTGNNPQERAKSSRFACVSKDAVDKAIFFTITEPEYKFVDLSSIGLGSHWEVNPLQCAPVNHTFLTNSMHDNGMFELTSPDEKTHLTILHDLEGDIFLSCGVLPRKRISIPTDFLRNSLANLAPTVKVAPVLAVPGTDNSVHLVTPTPHEPGYRISWRRRATTMQNGLMDVSYPSTLIGSTPKFGDVPGARVQMHQGWYSWEKEPRG